MGEIRGRFQFVVEIAHKAVVLILISLLISIYASNICSVFLFQYTLGLDCEFVSCDGGFSDQVAVMQIACFEKIYLLDLLAYPPENFLEDWESFICDVLLQQPRLVLGYDPKSDLRTLANTHSCFENLREQFK